MSTATLLVAVLSLLSWAPTSSGNLRQYIRLEASGESTWDGTVTSLVAFTEDRALAAQGCDAVSVFDLASRSWQHKGRTVVSPGRLTGTSDFSRVIAVASNYGSRWSVASPFLYSIRRLGGQWTSEIVEGATFVMAGGIAIGPDDDSLLVATASVSNGLGGTQRGPYAINRYSLREIVGERLGPVRGTLAVAARPAEIITSVDGESAYAFLVDGRVLTFDVSRMELVGPAIIAGPLVYPGADEARMSAGLGHATISPDGRYLVTNRWNARAINVVDLIDGTSTLVPVPFQPVGGVAFSYGPMNEGLLAMHGMRRIAVFEFLPPASLVEKARAAIGPPYVEPLDPVPSGPYAAIAWSGDGAQLIAASDRGGAEFQVFSVEGGGTRVVPQQLVAACGDALNIANDIYTVNRPRVPTPTATSTASPTGYSTSTATSIATLTPVPISTPQRPPRPIYLPLLLNQRACVPGQKHVDVVLAIDASTTMLELTLAGRPKLEAAKGAAIGFVDRLSPDDQAAIVAFNADAWLAQGLTSDHLLLAAAVEAITVDQQTCIACAVDVSAAELAGTRSLADNQPVLILLTDGKSNPRPVTDAEARAEVAKSAGVTIFTIGLGSDLDDAALVRIASRVEYYYHAPDAEDLVEIFEAIAVGIPCPVDA